MAIPSDIHKDFVELAHKMEDIYGVDDWRSTRHGHYPIKGALHFPEVLIPKSHSNKSYGGGSFSPQALDNKFWRILEEKSPSTASAIRRALSAEGDRSNGVRIQRIGQKVPQRDHDSPDRSPRSPRDEGIAQIRTKRLYTGVVSVSSDASPVIFKRRMEDGTEVEFTPRTYRQEIVDLVTELHRDGVSYADMIREYVGDPKMSYLDREFNNLDQKLRRLRLKGVGDISFVRGIEHALDRLTAPERKRPLMEQVRSCLPVEEQPGVTHQEPLSEELTPPPVSTERVPDRLLDALYHELTVTGEFEDRKWILTQIRELTGR